MRLTVLLNAMCYSFAALAGISAATQIRAERPDNFAAHGLEIFGKGWEKNMEIEDIRKKERQTQNGIWDWKSEEGDEGLFDKIKKGKGRENLKTDISNRVLEITKAFLFNSVSVGKVQTGPLPPFTNKNNKKIKLADEMLKNRRIMDENTNIWTTDFNKVNDGDVIEFDKTMVGITMDGREVTLHCNPGKCTLGSLNRHATISGVPMMVPKALLKMEYYGGLKDGTPEKESIWLALAAATWSDRWAKNDKNAESAISRLRNQPDTYAEAQKIFAASSVKDPKVLALIQNDYVDAIPEISGNTGTVIDTDGNIVVIEKTDETETTETVGARSCAGAGDTDCVDNYTNQWR